MTPYKIYIFKKYSTLYAIAEAEGMEFGASFKLVKDKNSKLNNAANIYKRARDSIVNAVSNSLNAVQMFGKEALDEDGNVNWLLFQECQMKHALICGKNNRDYDKEIKTFDLEYISLKEAKKKKLI